MIKATLTTIALSLSLAVPGLASDRSLDRCWIETSEQATEVPCDLNQTLEGHRPVWRYPVETWQATLYNRDRTVWMPVTIVLWWDGETGEIWYGSGRTEDVKVVREYTDILLVKDGGETIRLRPSLSSRAKPTFVFE